MKQLAVFAFVLTLLGSSVFLIGIRMGVAAIEMAGFVLTLPLTLLAAVAISAAVTGFLAGLVASTLSSLARALAWGRAWLRRRLG